MIIPPTIGAAIRCITSAPVPELSMIGRRPAMITATVIALGRTRSTAPSSIAATNASYVRSPCARRASQAWRRYRSITTPNSAATPASAMKPTAVATDVE